MVILYIGNSNSSSTSMHRASALSRIGHNILVKDPYDEVFNRISSSIVKKIHFHTGYRLLQKQMFKWVTKILHSTPKFDLIWIDSGELLGYACIKFLTSTRLPVLIYNIDDPTGKRDGHRFDSLLQAIPLYDYAVLVRHETEVEFNKLGAKKVIRVFRSYDEVAHTPFVKITDIPSTFRSEVAFIGTWMRHEKRDEFLIELIKQGIPVSIWGDRWSKSPYWQQLSPYYRGGALGGREYVAAIQGAKICLGLLSKGNRDLHTTRSLEVPYAGGLLCAERTSEHVEMYKEGEEAVFWSDATECASICKKLLSNDSLRERIRLAGMDKVRALGVGNEDVCRQILNTIGIS